MIREAASDKENSYVTLKDFVSIYLVFIKLKLLLEMSFIKIGETSVSLLLNILNVCDLRIKSSISILTIIIYSKINKRIIKKRVLKNLIRE